MREQGATGSTTRTPERSADGDFVFAKLLTNSPFVIQSTTDERTVTPSCVRGGKNSREMRGGFPLSCCERMSMILGHGEEEAELMDYN